MMNKFEIHAFDFQSHSSMHLNFNEGYLRTVRIAFPESPIHFYACSGHIETLSDWCNDVSDVQYHAIDRFEVPLGLSRHNPIAGRWVAHRCRRDILNNIRNRPLRFVALLGEDANLYSVIGRRWPKISKAPLHMILHNHLGEAVRWRSRNPFIRMGDLITQIQHPLPDQVFILALELGIRERIHELFPNIAPSVLTYEHPLLVSEWLATPEAMPETPIKIGFLGNSSRTKGFHTFVEAAEACAHSGMEFHAIGIASNDSRKLNLSALKRLPVEGGLSRKDYLNTLSEINFVCLPLSNIGYDFIASGSIIDAIAGLKPIIALKTRVLEAIFDKYGPIGYLANNETELINFIKMELPEALKMRSQWVDNLKKIRVARRPDSLSEVYRGFLS